MIEFPAITVPTDSAERLKLVDDREFPRTRSCFVTGVRRWRNVPTPKQDPTKVVALRREHQDIANRILAAMSAGDREVLMRFYVQGQAVEQILADLGLTETQFRLIKSIARSSFTAHVRQPIRATGGDSQPVE